MYNSSIYFFEKKVLRTPAQTPVEGVVAAVVVVVVGDITGLVIVAVAIAVGSLVGGRPRVARGEAGAAGRERPGLFEPG